MDWASEISRSKLDPTLIYVLYDLEAAVSVDPPVVPDVNEFMKYMAGYFTINSDVLMDTIIHGVMEKFRFEAAMRINAHQENLRREIEGEC